MSFFRRIVIKVGTNVLAGSDLKLNHQRIKNLSKQLHFLWDQGVEVALVSSGAVAAGRELRSFHQEDNTIIKKQLLASIGQTKLIENYSKELQNFSIIAAQALLTKNLFDHSTTYSTAKRTLEGLLQNRVIPIINENDLADDKALLGDNDQLAALVTVMLEADLLLVMSDIDGLYSADPKKNSSAKLIEKVEQVSPEILKNCEDTRSVGGTGGMSSKLKAVKIVMDSGIPAIITAGKNDNVLEDLWSKKIIGTKFFSNQTKPLFL